jgi:hypothetical protein
VVSNTASVPRRHGGTIAVPLEALLTPDPELRLVWAPLAETGVPCENGACEDVCTCEREEPV